MSQNDGVTQRTKGMFAVVFEFSTSSEEENRQSEKNLMAFGEHWGSGVLSLEKFFFAKDEVMKFSL